MVGGMGGGPVMITLIHADTYDVEIHSQFSLPSFRS